MKNRWLKKGLALLLALVMCVSMLPAAVLAEDAAEALPTEQEEIVPDLPSEELTEPAETAEESGEIPEEPGDTAEEPDETSEEPGEIPEEPGEIPEEPGEEAEEPGETPEEPDETSEEPGEDAEKPGEDAEDEDPEKGALGGNDPDSKPEPEIFSCSGVRINPLYADVVDESEIPALRGLDRCRAVLREYALYRRDPQSGKPSVTFCEDTESAAASFRSQFVARSAGIAVYCALPVDADLNEMFDAIFDEGFVHTGRPQEGDYMDFQWGGCRYGFEYLDGDADTMYCCFLFSFLYYTSARQEAEMDSQAGYILNQLDLSGKTDYQKLFSIYTYLTSHVVYDFPHLNSNSYKLQYSGYAALVNGTAVCQGISVAFYRLALQAGLDARIISSDAMCHAWNIARCDGTYYALDATWDLGYRPDDYWWFLKGSSYWLSQHISNDVSVLGDQYNDASFSALYAIPGANYVPSQACYTVFYDANGGVNAPTAQIKTPGVAIRLSSTAPTRDGFRFLGWARSADAASAAFQPGQTYSTDAALTLFAVWERVADAEHGTYGQMEYSLLNGEITITACDASVSGALTIPAAIGGYPVAAVGERAFRDCTELTAVTVPASVRSIGPGAFSGCRSLAQVSLPEGITEISDDVFFDCQALESITIPASVAAIGEKAFSCSGLTGITIPMTVQTIGAYAFQSCVSLTEIYFGHGQSASLAIGAYAFSLFPREPGSELPTNIYVPDVDNKNLAISGYDWDYSYRNVSFLDLPFQTYTVNYYLNGGINNPANPASYTSLDTIVLAAPSREGYVFAGWYASEDFSGEPVTQLAGGVPAAVWAKWEPIVYSIHFDPNGGTGSTADLGGCQTDVEYPLPACGFTRTGYVFAGWSTAQDDSGALYQPGDPVKNLCSEQNVTVTFYAQWVPISYAIAFDPNGGEGEMVALDALYGQDAVLPANVFTRTGYSFVGWNTQADGMGTPYADEATVISLTAEENAVVILYAKWEPIVYTIRFDPNGGTGSTADLSGCQTDVEYPLPACGFTRTGYSFAGWSLAPDDGGTPYQPGETVKNLCSEDNGVAILYARWAPISYAVAFDPNGGEGEMDALDALYGQDAVLPVNVFNRTGYSFAGWSTQADGTGTAYTDGATVRSLSAVENAVVVLYAQWAPNTYTVFFDSNGGTGTMAPQTMTYGKAAALKANAFQKASHTFLGWALAPSAAAPLYTDKQKVSDLTAAPNGEITLYAVWAKYSYQIVFYPNGGTGDMADDGGFCEYDAVYELPLCTYTRPGFDFLGWATSAKGKVVYTDGQSVSRLSTTNGKVIKLYAVWRAHKYRVVFDPNGGSGAMKAMSCTCGKSYTLTANAFKRTGYTFTGWNTEPDGSGVAFKNKAKQANFSTESGDLKLYAQWTLTAYKITYKNIAATDQNPNPASYTIQNAVLLAEAARPGCSFLGWYADSGFKKPVTGIDIGKTGARTFYAKWGGSAYTYDVVFDPNGGTGTMKDLKKLSCGKTYTLTANDYKRTGYTFAGWNTERDGSGVAIQNKAKIANLSEQNGAVVKLYAQWTPTVYKITYKNVTVYDGNQNPASYTILDAFTLTAPTRPGCSFAGWYSDSGFKKPVTQIAAGRTGNLTLYAKWTGKAAVYTIAFNKNGATSGKMASMTKRSCGTGYTLTANTFKRTGYRFIGWNTAPDGSGVAFANKAKVGNLCTVNGGTATLYAQWEPVVYPIIYKNVNQARMPEKTGYTIEEGFELPVPVKEGQVFLGWYSTATFKAGTRVEAIEPGTTGSKTFYAKWMLLRPGNPGNSTQ